ncbi:unnamed protein product [Rotaria sp. Silwood2]|nr:unnamed protein product [Rotaria sp. Silwood2]CAF2894388.1 unnamed protein product [Rotaria sp. Silwood2]CAF3901905.1 unnamed protein product [Rotaria sp. Silwood2]CAF4072364.1 unnamed protein product [Rotaria sp. Silwood2]
MNKSVSDAPNKEEETYQLLEQLDHILKRPETYIGSNRPCREEMWVVDESGIEGPKIVKKEITYVPGLYKIFDEILVNAADNKQRDKTMSSIEVDINQEKGEIKICNDGHGIPVRKWAQDESIYIPTLIFGKLLTSDNFNDNQKRVTGGRNGYGAKVTNIFSKKFTIETCSKEFKKLFKQTWTNNMRDPQDAIITKAENSKEFTRITFIPDLKRFQMDKLDDDHIALFKRRAYDVAVSTGCKVTLNGTRIPVKTMKDYMLMYIDTDEKEVVYKKVNDRWEIGLAKNDHTNGFTQVSFVNSILTSEGGKHVDYITEQICPKLAEHIKKKSKAAGENLKPMQVKSHIFLFLNCLIENPEFESQAKKQLATERKNFGSTCLLKNDGNFIKDIIKKTGIVESVINWLEHRQDAKLHKQSGSKTSKLKGIPKLDDANDAGTKNSINCTLIVTEGDSAKALAVAGLGVIGRDRYGVYPLKGKLLNVREATTKKMTENSEISQLVKILGLNYGEKYVDKSDLSKLRYGKLMIMADQDQDGSHIKGLVINFIHYKWPNLLKHDYIEVFITPILKVSKGSEVLSFYSMPEFEQWQTSTPNWQKWKCKYYKGLGTSTAKEAKEYFSNMERHRIIFKYQSIKDDLAIQLAFNSALSDDRKDWIKWHTEDINQRREQKLPMDYLYRKDTKQINFNDFVNKELVLFSKSSTERAIPNIMDGLKPGQRKIMFVCFTKNLIREIKVAQLGGKVAENSAYHHGEQSLTNTIVGLAQNFVGSNNINFLVPAGQFGTRLHGGNDAASARYIFTRLSPLALSLFNKNDEPLLTYLNEDGMSIEPEWYCPIIPTVLVNGGHGVGTGYSTDIPSYNPLTLSNNMKYYIRQERERQHQLNNPTSEPKKYSDVITLVELIPWFKNFTGEIKLLDNDRTRGVINGVCAKLDESTIEITDLPVGTWTQQYKENVLETMLHPKKNDIAPSILDYKEYHTDTTVRFVVKLSHEQFAKFNEAGLHKSFRLQDTFKLTNMVLFDHNGILRRYKTAEEISEEFFMVRLQMYVKRKEYMVGTLKSQCEKLDNIARFIKEKIENAISVENKKISAVIDMLVERKYARDPEKVWREEAKKKFAVELATHAVHEDTDQLADLQQKQDDEEDEAIDDGDNNKKKKPKTTTSNQVDTTYYDYLINMSLRNLTKERRDEIVKDQKEKHDKLDALEKKSPEDLYEDDIFNFETEYRKVLEKERADEMSEVAHPTTKKAGGDNKARKRQTTKPQRAETRPAPHGKRITPVIDPALVKKVNEEILKRTKEEKTVEDKKSIIEYLVKEGVTSEEITNIMQMRCREKKKIGGVTEKKSTETKDKKLNGTIDENDENSNVSMMSVDGNDNSGLVKEEVTPKRNAQRTAKEKVTQYGGDNDNEDDDSIIHEMEIDDNESDYMGSDSETEKKIKKGSTKPKQPRKPKSATANNATSPTKKKTAAKRSASVVLMDNQQDDGESSAKNKKTEKPKKPRVKKEPGATPKKDTVKKEAKKVVKRPKSDDSDEDDIPILSNTSTPTKKPRTQRTAAAKKSYHISDDDDDDEDYV